MWSAEWILDVDVVEESSDVDVEFEEMDDQVEVMLTC